MRSLDFWLGEGENHKLHAMTSSEMFEKRNFLGQRYRKMEEQKPWSGLPKLKRENVKHGRRM